MFGSIARVLSLPFRLIGRLFRGGPAARVAGKSGSSYAAKRAAPREVLGEEFAESPPAGIEAALFKQLPRPRLTERSASDLTIEDARRHLEHAETFYTRPFSLFARGDFFYEEVEEEHLNAALGYGAGSIDERFLDVMTVFRRALNDNTRRLLVVYAPVILAATVLLGAVLAPIYGEALARLLGGGRWAGVIGAFALAELIGFAAVLILFSWPFKVTQQRNLLNLDNYITSKFARINNNFQVAKRRALNVERNMRMGQSEALKDEAGVWTMTYQWFAMRLLLCELMIRNRLYQIRRNTTLYWLAGLGLSAAIAIGASLGAQMLGRADAALAILAVGGAHLLFAYGLMRGAARFMVSALEGNEWSRFHLVDLPKTIRDHVGEDKVQIVTFRDRNRLE